MKDRYFFANALLLLFCFLPYFSQAQRVEKEWQDTLFKASVQDLLKLGVQEESTLVSTVSQKDEKIEDVPASIMVITREQIVERGYEDISDLLKDLPAFDVSENAGRYGEYYTVRGINGNDRFLIMVNGRKLNAFSGTFLSVGNSISIRFAQRVEIVYGASSVVYGSDAFACVVNIIFDHAESVQKLNLQASRGSFNTTDAFLGGNITRLGGNLSLRFFVRSYQSDGFSPETAAFALAKRYPAPLSNTFEQPLQNHTLFFEAQYRKFRFGYFRQYFNEGNSRSLNPSIYIHSKEAKWELSKDIYWLNYQKDFKNGILKADLSLTYHDQKNETKFFRFTVPNDPASVLQHQFMTGKDLTAKILLTYQHTFSEKINLISGLQYENTNSIPAYANDHVLNAPLRYAAENAEKIDKELTINEQKIGVFSQISYSPIPKVNLTAALRYDWSRLFDPTFNPRIALIYKPLEQTTLKAIYGTAFQAPSFFYKYEQFGNAAVVMIPNANQDFILKNQKVTNAELNLMQNIGKTQFTLIGFYNEANNLIERIQYTSSIFNKYVGRNTAGLRNENIGLQTAWGVTLNVLGRIKDKIEFYGHYTFTEANFERLTDRAKLPLPRLAPHKLMGGITLRNLVKHFTLQSSLRWCGDVNVQPANRTYTKGQQAPGYTMLRFNISAKDLIPHTRFFANSESMIGGNAENVGIFDGGIYTDMLPQPKFTFRVGVEATF